MAKFGTSIRHGVRSPRRRRLAAIVGSAALVAMLSGNVAARQLIDDRDWASTPLVTPRAAHQFTATDWFARKLGTTAGRKALVF